MGLNQKSKADMDVSLLWWMTKNKAICM